MLSFFSYTNNDFCQFSVFTYNLLEAETLVTQYLAPSRFLRSCMFYACKLPKIFCDVAF